MGDGPPARELRAVAVFCGSSMPSDARFRTTTVALAEAIAHRGLELVYGGGGIGLMGVLADAAMAAGGRVVGVLPVGLFTREVGHRGLTELREVRSMHERKAVMYDRADGVVALPGGLGTLEELAEVATWTQLGLHSTPVVLLDVGGFWTPLVRLLDTMVEVGLLKQANRDIIRLADGPDAALDLLADLPRHVDKWITADDR